MKKTIKFGEYSAELNAGEYRAGLNVNTKELPLALADKLNEVGDIQATEVARDDNGTPFIRLLHDLTSGDLLNAVCEAIGEVYNSDITVTNETATRTV